MRIFTRDADKGMAQIARIGHADGNGHLRFNQLRRLFDMHFDIGANASGITQRLALSKLRRITARRGNAISQRPARARMAQFQRAGRQAGQ